MNKTCSTISLSACSAIALLSGGCGNYQYANPFSSADAPAMAAETAPANNTKPAAPAVNAPRDPAFASSNSAPVIGTASIDALAAMERPAANTTNFIPAPATTSEPAAFTPGNYPEGDASSPISDTIDGLTQVSFASDGADFDPCVSRDGKWMVFASTQHRPTADIYVKQVGARAVTQLTADPANDVMPALSPDASRIAFCSDRNGFWNLYVVSAKGGQAVQLTAERTHDLHPSWSPDGKHIAFSRLGQMSGRWELWVMNIEQPAQLEFVGYGMFPHFNPVAGTGAGGSDKLLYQRGRERGDRAFSLWTIDYKPGDAGNPTEVVASRGLATINPCWSPDGQWIAYSLTTPGQSSAGKSDLWIASADGSSRVNLTAGRFANAMPSWSSDNRIYFVSNRAGTDTIWSLSADKALAAASASSPSTAAKPKSDSKSSASAEQTEP